MSEDHRVPSRASGHYTDTARVDAGPLSWWRTRPPSSFDFADRENLVVTLASLDLPQIPQWRAAAKGDPAASLGVAFALLPIAGFQPKTFDCVMSAVLRCALLGESANIAMLVHVLGRRGRRRTDLGLVLLAGAWCRTGSLLANEKTRCTVEKRS